MMIYHATKKNLNEVVSWIDTKLDCRVWGGPSVSYPINLKVLIEEIDFQENNSYVFKVKDRVMGFGQVIQKSEGVRHLARIIVNPESRGKGYGLELCKFLILIAMENGNRVTLNVYRTNQAAVALYSRLGFTEDKDRSTNENVFMVKT